MKSTVFFSIFSATPITNKCKIKIRGIFLTYKLFIIFLIRTISIFKLLYDGR